MSTDKEVFRLTFPQTSIQFRVSKALAQMAEEEDDQEEETGTKNNKEDEAKEAGETEEVAKTESTEGKLKAPALPAGRRYRKLVSSLPLIIA